VVVSHHAIHRLVVVIPGWWIVLENLVVELVEDPELQAMLFKERQDVIYA